MSRIVLSIGGSVLAPELDAGRIDEYASVIDDIVDEGFEIGVVVGGGSVARRYIETARSLGANEIHLDRIGIRVTRLNALLLVSALAERGLPTVTTPPEDYGTAHEAIDRGDVAVMGGTEPAHTTDAVSAALAEDIGATRLVYATSTAGVYDADPGEDEGARRYDEITAGTLARTIVDLGLDAGTSAPVDLLAAMILQRAGLEAIVIDGTDPDRIRRAVLADEFDGTRVVPDGTGTDRFDGDRDR